MLREVVPVPLSELKSHASRKSYVFCSLKRASQSRKQLSRQFAATKSPCFDSPPWVDRFPVPVEALMPVEMQENGLGSALHRKITSFALTKTGECEKTAL